ncbi:hypothetical protein [Shewanella xiamenensis]|uniref:Uncharacterized protein n=1 Tax=Shewanella xiamenensis TaxID=332186 RepID=A0AAE4Q3W9_9GAMM|nr:hypothetical protein [Shewanella xiamenensis]MDV5392254.1 hypothetical protein [Shewanella xiamenensis]
MSLFEPKFDLDNPQHLQLRSLMAEMFARHAEAISQKHYWMAENFEAQAIGISRAAARLTDGCDCMHLASELASSMMALSRAAMAREVA